MTSFLFWNLNKKPLQSLISNIASYRQVDVVMLVECSIAPDVLLESLNAGKPSYHYAANRICEEVEVFCRFSSNFIQPILETERLTVRHLKLPGVIDALIAITHFPSKLHWSDSSQVMECVELSDALLVAEEQAGHSRTLLVGDLNMNPFEDGIVSARGLHGVMSRDIAERRMRIIQARQYPLFYNPMWSLLGDMSAGPPGTYYYSSSEYRVFFWNMFDQVLIRPDLLPSFNNKALEIVQSDGTMSFLSSKGLPNSKVASDHLPLFFELSL